VLAIDRRYSSHQASPLGARVTAVLEQHADMGWIRLRCRELKK
jgi:hypothetical protein